MQQLTCIAIDDDNLFLGQLQAYIEEIDWLDLKGTYNNPVQAATAIIKDEPDILFLDIEMPHLDGYALMDWILPRLEEMETKPRIVVVSGSVEKIDHQDVLMHIQKTTLVNPENLEKLLKWAIENEVSDTIL